ncbi:PadR family transcriptional regulator [Frankia sp. R43]|nr:PadR family transcriptional regulator [Frankia sp. R43]
MGTGRVARRDAAVVRRDAAGLPPTSYAVLGLLAVADLPMSAVELKTRAEFSLRFFYWAPAVSHIRKELTRLAELGLVTATEVPAPRVRRTLVHEITDAGRTVLRNWLDDLPDDEPVVLKDPVLLRVWLGAQGDPDRIVRLLDQHLERTRAAIDDLQWGRRRAREMGLDNVPRLRHSRAVGDYVLRRLYAELANLTQLRDEITCRPTEPRPPTAGPPPLHEYDDDDDDGDRDGTSRSDEHTGTRG